MAQPSSELSPWAATATRPVIAEEKTIQNAGAALSGTLYLPAEGKVSAAIVVVHGASSPLRTSPLYEHLKQMLPPLGIAVFVYDRRGSGRSGGDPKANDFPLLADDAIAAVRMLKADGRIDPSKIGIWGLSQGGWLSLLAAARSTDVRFVVSISAPLVSPDVQMMFSSTNSLIVNGYRKADIDQMVATRKAVDDYMRGTVSKDYAQAKIDDVKDKSWFKYLYMGTTLSDREDSSWRREIEYDPLQTLRAVKVPSLVVFGAIDPVVPVATSIKRLMAFTSSHPSVQVDVIAGADHGMQTTVPAKDLLDPNRADDERPDSLEYLGELVSWLTQHHFARSSASEFVSVRPAAGD